MEITEEDFMDGKNLDDELKIFFNSFSPMMHLNLPITKHFYDFSLKAVFSDYLSQDKHSSCFPPTFEFLTLNSDKERPSK